MTTTAHERRVQELLELAAAEGLVLPLPADVIARLEETGAVVDLVTGAVIVAGADQRYGLTVVGEAVAVAAGAGAGDL